MHLKRSLNHNRNTSPASSRLAEAKAEAARNLEAWQRNAADFANYRRRVGEERQQYLAQANAELVKNLLPVLDDFERSRAQADRPPAWGDGIDLIERKLRNALEVAGLSEIKAIGHSFDPTFHEAVTHEPSDAHFEGEVIGQIRAGYCFNGRVLRPAMVRVAKATGEQFAENNDEQDQEIEKED